MKIDLTSSGQWSSVAECWFTAIGHPLRPGDADIAAFRSFCEPAIASSNNPKALIMGVTPELYHMLSPLCDTQAIDRNEAMIDLVWPGERSAVTRKEWLRLADVDELFDVVVIDGGIHLVDYPIEQEQLLSGIAAHLRPGGRLVARLFSPPQMRENVESVTEALARGEIASVNHLKIRMGNAIQQSSETGARLNDVWEAIQSHGDILLQLEGTPGWRREEIEALGFYRGQQAKYAFVSIEQVLNMANRLDNPLQHEGTRVPDYPMGDQFPVICLSRPA
jgi:SAM-dependent methyltransferase